MRPNKFRLIWASSFREEKLTNQKQELPMAAMFIKENGWIFSPPGRKAM
jgi:hypothetical protein